MLWVFSDGTRLRIGGVVEGAGPFADLIRVLLSAEKQTRRVYVQGPASVPLDPNNPWLLDLWARNLARSRGLRVTSDYQPDEADIPPEVRAIYALPPVPEGARS